ncbi:MAG: hypothetical protein WEB09_03850 [Nitriliruptor sp.]
MKKYFAAAGAILIAGTVAASAATFGVGDSVLAAGTGDVRNCGPLTVESWAAEMDNSAVYWVNVSLESQACYDDGVAVLADANGIGGSGTASGDAGDSVRVNFDTPVDIASLEEIDFVVHTQ